jgi:hypothetical protein
VDKIAGVHGRTATISQFAQATAEATVTPAGSSQ